MVGPGPCVSPVFTRTQIYRALKCQGNDAWRTARIIREMGLPLWVGHKYTPEQTAAIMERFFQMKGKASLGVEPRS